MRQDDHEQDHQRDDRQQRVVRDPAGQQQALVRAKRADRLRGEAERIAANLACGA